MKALGTQVTLPMASKSCLETNTTQTLDRCSLGRTPKTHCPLKMSPTLPDTNSAPTRVLEVHPRGSKESYHCSVAPVDSPLQKWAPGFRTDLSGYQVKRGLSKYNHQARPVDYVLCVVARSWYSRKYYGPSIIL